MTRMSSHTLDVLAGLKLPRRRQTWPLYMYCGEIVISGVLYRPFTSVTSHSVGQNKHDVDNRASIRIDVHAEYMKQFGFFYLGRE